MISNRKQIARYLIGDFISANVAWCIFNVVRFSRFSYHIGTSSLKNFLLSERVIEGQIFFPLMMMVLFYLSGYYNRPFFKSRLQELLSTVQTIFISTLLAFFIALINDVMPFRSDNYLNLLILFIIQFSCVYSVRLCITTQATHNIHHRKWSFNTLVVGCGETAKELVDELERMKKSMGYHVVGYVRFTGEADAPAIDKPVYDFDQLPSVCRQLDIKELIIAPDRTDLATLYQRINALYPLNLPIKIRIKEFNAITSRIRLTNIYATPLIDITSCAITDGGKNLKRCCDVLFSAIALLILSPVFILLFVLIKCDSRGPIFYKQERIGYRHKPFFLYKLRTMYSDAEKNGPQLSSEDDARITPIGKYLRKYRLDELPQFWNVLKGDMSLVGPRPEREFYIRQIVERAPYYSLLHQIRPGITSWGMVKFGYAKNVDEMIERLKYDMLYLENMSMLIDLKIIIYTVKTVITGKGM